MAVAARAGTPSVRPGRDRVVSWATVCALVLFMASDYKLRVRANDQAISGQADPFVLLEIGLYGLVAIFLVHRFGRAPRIRRVTVPIFVATAWVLIMAISATYSPYPALAAIRAVELIIVLALVRSIASHADRADLHELAHWFLGLVAASVIFGILFPMPRFALQQDRFTWLRLHPVQAGIFVGIATVIALAYLLAGSSPRPGPRWPRPVYAVLFALVGGGLIATNTRGATLGAAAGMLLVAFVTRSGRRKVDLTILLGVAAVGFALASSAQITAFFARGEDTRQLASLNSRTELWSEAMTFVKQQPIYGWGMGASRGLFLDTIGLGGAHNAAVNALVDTGIVGLVSWLAVVVTVVVLCARIPRLAMGAYWDRAIVLGILVFLLVDSVFTEAPAAAANVGSTWLLLLVAWADVLRKDVGTVQVVQEPVRRPEKPSTVKVTRLAPRFQRRPGP